MVGRVCCDDLQLSDTIHCIHKPNKNKCKQNQMNGSNNPVSIVKARDSCGHICQTNTTTGLALVKTNL